MAENIPPGFEFAGWKLNPEWTYHYLKRPTRLRWESMGSRPVARMPEFHLSDREARDLAIYLNTLRPVKYEAPLAWAVDRVDTTKARAGAAIVKSNFCKTCHRIGGRGGRLGPDLTGVGARLKHDYIYRFIRDPRLFVPGTPMKDFELSDEEVEAVVHYLLAQGGDGQ